MMSQGARMQAGIFYGIGVGPGDPELITMKGARILNQCRHVFVPKTRMEKKSTALAIARQYLGPDSEIHELVFPMTSDRDELSQHWEDAGNHISTIIKGGEDACFLTLGDPFLYSTYIYLLRVLRRLIPEIEVTTVPGVTSFNAAAALTEFVVGEGTESVHVVPTADNMDAVREALQSGGTIVLMKIGRHLERVLDLLEEFGLMEHGIFVSRAGMEDQYIELDLNNLRDRKPQASYFSIMLIHAGNQGSRAR